ncbi:MAG: hypothetical protein LUD69_04395 [Oscillospiraceae bacterium]|nr:hypothetical protein [Oscillospiraceae bacterium]MCD8376160.1 hypothetical protein [Oscillospiraceae bacterium]
MNNNELALNKLKSIIGASAFEELCDEMPGAEIRIPQGYLGGCTSKDERNRAIRQDYYNNLDIKEIAEKWKLSVPHIYHIIQRRG